MKKILFVCSGNICCSVMAQYMMQTMVDSLGQGKLYRIDSAAATKVHEGEDIYPDAKKKLEEMGVPAGPHKARAMTWDDYDRFDYLIGMDQTNIDDMRYIVGSDPDGKIHKLSEFCPGAGKVQDAGNMQGSGKLQGAGNLPDTGDYPDIEDPWYSDDFDTAYRQIQEGLMGLLNRLS